MKPRPDGLLSDDRLSHDSEVFDYIRELHEYLWAFVRVAMPGASGDLTQLVDEGLRLLKERMENPKPAPLPHEMDAAGWCRHCDKYYVCGCDSCPARNEPPAGDRYELWGAPILEKPPAETTGTPWVDEALPPREKAEALPEVISTLIYRYHSQDCGWSIKDAQADCEIVSRALLAECRKIARDEALIAFRAGGSDEILSDMHRIARCEIEKSHIEALSGVCQCFPKRTTVSVDCLARHLRIVPGKEGE